MAAPDPVHIRRAQVARWVKIAKQVGYGLFGAAIVLFGIGYAAGYSPAMTTLITLGLVVGSVVLAPAIVFGYGVRSAEREERNRPRR